MRIASICVITAVALSAATSVSGSRSNATQRLQTREAGAEPKGDLAARSTDVPTGVRAEPTVESPPKSGHSVQAAGRVVPRTELDLKSKIAGEVRNVLVEVGRAVRRGDVLVELDENAVQMDLKRAEGALKTSRTRLEQARQAAEIAEQNLITSKARIAASVRAATARSQRAKARADRIEQAAKKFVTSQEQCEAAKAEAVEAAANLDISRLQVDDVRELELSIELRREDVTCAETQVLMDQLGVDAARQHLMDTKILAPFEGTVVRCCVQAGTLVSAGTSAADTRLMTIADLSQLQVVAEVTAEEVGDIRKGQEVSIECGTEWLAGTVTAVVPCGTHCNQKVMFEVTIALQATGRLRPEMPAVVTIHTDKQ